MAAKPGKTVRTRDGREFALDAGLCEDSTILRDRPTNDTDVVKLDCANATLRMLLDAHRRRRFPASCRDTYRLLELTMELQLENLTRSCLKHLFRIPDFWRVNYMNESPDALVLTCFKESLRRLHRTQAVYAHEIWQITKLSRGNDQDKSVIDAVKSTTREFIELELDPVPIYYWMRSLPIVIMNRRGKRETAICRDGKCITYELFGKNFDLSSAEIDAFYLKYASFVLYKSRDKVYWKNLRQRTDARQVRGNCKFFISREDDVFIVTEEESENRVWEWVGNKKHGGSFVIIHRTPDKISALDFEADAKLLILKKRGSLSVMKVKDHELVLKCTFRGDFHSSWFHDRQLFTTSLREGTEMDFEVRRCKLTRSWLSDEATSPETTDGFYGETDYELQKFAKDGSFTSLGGSIFKCSQYGLEMFHGRSRSLLLNPEELVTSSELPLFP